MHEYPILVLQSLVLFPNQEVKIELSNDISKEIINKSIKKNDSEILIVSIEDELEIRPNIDDLPNVVTLAKIKNSITLPNGNIRIMLIGLKRCKVKKYNASDSNITCKIEDIKQEEKNSDEEKAYIRKLKKGLKEYVNANSEASNWIIEITKNITNLSKLTDVISISLDLSYKEKYELLLEKDSFSRAKKLIALLKEEVSSLEFDKKIDDEIRNNYLSNEEELLIKEKINVLSRKLGSGKDIHEECLNYIDKINSFDIEEKIKNSLKREVDRLERTTETSPEFASLRSYLEFVTNLPWNKNNNEIIDVNSTKKYLNKSHYGLDSAKTRIEEYLILKEKNKDLKSPILCLVGPPGTGKTTFARELAKSINREFIKISVGGLNDSSELIGHRRTYMGSAPGKIMDGIRKCGVNNPVILIDEVDKMVKDYKGDPSSVLLEILDSNQNREFMDNYIGEPFNLSSVLFILTANDINNIPPALLDRLEIININSYTVYDKIEIVKKYTIPRLSKEYKFDQKKFEITDKGITRIIDEYTKEAGMRELERCIACIIRRILIEDKLPITLREEDIQKYLGKPKYAQIKNTYDKCGTVNAPAKSDFGGLVINIECAIIDGNENIITTGSLGDVMKESVSLAVSYLKVNAKKYKLDIKKLSSTIHIHALESATKKDGPSAGLAITTSIVSSILNKKVPLDSAFTGEMSLEGRILKVGGIKEKIISSYNQGMKRIFIPTENISDLNEIPRKVCDNINIVPVSNFEEVFDMIFN